MRWLNLVAIVLVAASPVSAKEAQWEGYDKWPARHLRAMAEPSFASARAIDGFQQRIRILVLPTFQSGYSIRVDVPLSGKARIVVVSETGQGGYSPGRKKSVSAHDGDADTPKYVQAALRASGIDSETADAKAIEVGNDEAIVCTDGTAFFLEYFDAKHRHRIIKRSGCDVLYGSQRAIVPVAVMLHGVAKVPLEWHVWSCVAAAAACGDWNKYGQLMDGS